MIQKMYKEYILSCDFCGKQAEETSSTFQGALDIRESLEWHVRKNVNGEWEVACDECK
jgi:hypothetical protein